MTASVQIESVALQPFTLALAPRPLMVLILARDEADVLPDTLDAVRAGLTPGDRLCVVADHCRDATARVARQAGATVYTRRAGESAGKGAALRWWLGQTALEAPDDEGIVILDADSRPGPGLLDSLRARLARGEVAVQARLEPLLADDSPVPLLAAFSETVEQSVFDSLKTRWRWPVRLHGTGMAFTRSVLTRAAQSLRTPAEDAELTVLLAAAGVPITLALETSVIDPKPSDTRGAVRQRARWFRGQGQVLRRHPRSIVALLGQGPSGWALLTSIFLQPKSLFVPLKAGIALAAAAAWSYGLGSAWMIVAGLLSLALAVDLAGLAAGLALSPRRRQVARALIAWPAFLAVWVASVVLSLAARRGWERARPSAPEHGRQSA
jgi:cellulose synthase/poly-beta-1,6-N-acetylglucosamine synthase-like glycosyltransferase